MSNGFPYNPPSQTGSIFNNTFFTPLGSTGPTGAQGSTGAKGSTGSISNLANGSTSAPSLAFTNSVQTGLYLSNTGASSDMAFCVNGTEMLDISTTQITSTLPMILNRTSGKLSTINGNTSGGSAGVSFCSLVVPASGGIYQINAVVLCLSYVSGNIGVELSYTDFGSNSYSGNMIGQSGGTTTNNLTGTGNLNCFGQTITAYPSSTISLITYTNSIGGLSNSNWYGLITQLA